MGTVKGPLGVRGRLLSAFVLVALPPLALLALAVNALLARTFEEESQRRLAQALASATSEIERLREQARPRVEAVAAVALPLASLPEEGERALAEGMARRRDLELLELVDAGGRVVSSHHWPAGFGLADRDLAFGDGSWRIDRTAEGYGQSRLALVAAEQPPAVWELEAVKRAPSQ